MITKTTAGNYVIASGHAWLPGVYATERAVRYAFRFPDAMLQSLADRICKAAGRAITTDDLREAKVVGEAEQDA